MGAPRTRCACYASSAGTWREKLLSSGNDIATKEPQVTTSSEPESKSGPSTALSPARVRACLAILVLLGFSLGCSEFVIIGIETELAASFNISLQTTGTLISGFALTYGLMTPLLTLVTGRFRRYQLLVAYCIIFCLGNLISAVAQSYEVLLAARIILGSVSGVLLAVGITFIPDLTDARRSPIIISIIYAAFSVAMVIATSLGKILADTVGWHVAMDAVLVMALITCAVAVAIMPRTGTTDAPATFREQLSLFKEPCIITGMLIFVFGVGSIYTFYGYVSPYLEQVIGMSAGEVSTTLMVYGIICFFSNLLGGWIDARFGIRALDVTFLIQAAVLLGIFLAGPAMPQALVFIMGLALVMYLASVSCISVFINVAHSRHPKALTLASSLEPLSFNVGISFGTAIGGSVIAGHGIAYVGLVGAGLAIIAAALAELTYRLSRTKRQR